MCGRFALSAKTKDIEKLVPSLVIEEDFEPRYNIAPSQNVACLRGGEDVLSFLRWGLIPFWAKDEKIGYKLINARSETLAEKPSFKNAFKKRRCLIFADGFYEWDKKSKTKAPFFISLKSGEPFAFAGLWERWKSEEKTVESTTIITTSPNELIDEIHSRMPAILPRRFFDMWLDPEFGDLVALSETLAPYPDDEMQMREVSTYVNNPANDSPECVRAVD